MIKEKCVICSKEITKRDKPRKSRSSAEITRYFRAFNAITCSHKCSEKYKTIYHRIKQNERGRKIALEKIDNLTGDLK